MNGDEDVARAARIEELFHLALELPPDRRGSFLIQACGREQSILREVAALLEADGSRLDLLGVVRQSFQPGDLIGRYKLVQKLGEGGMGEVFLARDTELLRRVAIKIMSHESPELRQRFRVEANATARCEHENIVRIHDVSEYEDTPYMVLEYIEGRTLREHLRHGSLPVERTLYLIARVIRALAYAHQRDIIHRDLKPENIMVTDGDVIKVLDFGLARIRSSADILRTLRPDEEPTDDLALTRRGAVFGTLPYMSPEQWQGGDVDAMSDLWAVGVMLWEMLLGRHPLGAITYENLSRIGDLAIPMPRMVEIAPAFGELGALIDSCLRKHKHERLASARELLTSIESLSGERLSEERLSSRSREAGRSHVVAADVKALLVGVANDGDGQLIADEFRGIEQALSKSTARGRMALVPFQIMALSQLVPTFIEHQPDIVHLSGRGGSGQDVYFQASDGNARSISSKGLSSMFLAHETRLALFNSCVQESVADALSAHVPCVIHLGHTVGDDDAHLFHAAFYRALADGHSVGAAFDYGSLEFELRGLALASMPRLFSSADVDARSIIFIERSSRPIDFRITIQGQVASYQDFQALLGKLRDLADDQSIICRRISEGSVILHLVGTRAGYLMLRSLDMDGLLSAYLGHEVSEVREQSMSISERSVLPTGFVGEKTEPTRESARLARIEELFSAAMSLPPSARIEFLERAGDDSELRRQVQALLLESLESDPGTALPRFMDTQPDGADDRPAPADYIIAAQLEHYRIEGLLVAGASMTGFYLAWDEELACRVAIKVLPSGEHATELGWREARLLLALNHENVIKAHRVFVHQERIHIVCEFIEGETLDGLLDREGPLPIDRAMGLVLQLARALAHVHEHGFVHRDIKPSNIMVTPEGRVKLLDFGIARHRDDEHLGTPGLVTGTPITMSPEQWLGSPDIDGRADLYALGVCLFFMLSDRVPFIARSMNEIEEAHLNEAPPRLDELIPHIPPVLARVVDRLLAKRPDDRFASANDLVRALEAIMNSLPS